MRKIFPFALLLVSCAAVFAQDTVGSGWTDKNNGEMYAAYILRIAYYEHGYMAAHVTVNQTGGKDVYVVEPGPVYHFKDVSIAGLAETDVRKVMQDAPKAGEVYSAGRVNDWLEQVKKVLGTEGRNQKVGHQRTQLDHSTASVNIRVMFE